MPTGGYEVTIGMAAATAAALSTEGAWLYALLAVETSNRATLPVVWLQSRRYSEKTTVRWPGACAAYTSPGRDSIGVGARIDPGFSVPISTGQLLTIDQPTGTGQVTQPGPSAKALAIFNQTTTPFTAGVSQKLDGVFMPICTLPLYGQSVELIVPLEQILLAFSTRPMTPGTVVTLLLGPGMLIDLTGASERSVQYDINRGWSCGGQTWGRAVAPIEEVLPLLVKRSEALSRAARRAVASM
ncbi:MAG TPA: hypothetical protein VFR48_03715 [Solirubrobacteraceae bacterium]|nr:hypothetical protein [Solirubrobacteraceae bacterium]